MLTPLRHLGRSKAWLLALATVLTAVAIGATPAPAAAAITYNEMVSASSGKCLDIPGADTSDAVWLGQWTCFDLPNQNWRFEGAGSDFFRIRSALHGKCVDVYNYAQQNGAAVVTYECIPGASNQEWKIVANNGNGLMLRARHSGKCLDLYAFSQQDGPRKIVQWDCNFMLNQYWRLRL